jgi:hypothetical protein
LTVLGNIRQRLDPEVIVRQVGHKGLPAQRDLRVRETIHQEMLELLVNLPDEDAQSILQRIRAGADIATLIDHIKSGNLLLQMAVSPETRFRYEFPYRSEMPEDYIANNPYLDSLVYEASSLYSAGGYPGSSRDAIVSRVPGLSSDEYEDIYLKPFHAAEVVDSLLFDAKI